MALTVSSIQADFVKDTKTIGKQSAYIVFHFGGREHTTDVSKSAGKFAEWDTPVQLTGAGITMKVVAKASKTLAHDKAIGIAEVNVLKVAGQGPQTVQLKDELTGSYAGEVRLTISGGSPAISGLPHTEGHGVVGAAENALHSHHGTGAAAGTGTGTGLGSTADNTTGQQGGVPGQQDNHRGLEGAAAGAGAAGLGAAALHHRNQGEQGVGQQGMGQQQGRPHESLGQRIEDKVIPGHHNQGEQGIGSQQGSYAGAQQGGLGSQQGDFGSQQGYGGQPTGIGGQQGGYTGGQQGSNTIGQQGGIPGQQDNYRGLEGAAAGAGAAGLGAAALHHRNQGEQGVGQQGVGQQQGRPHESLGQRIEDNVIPGHHYNRNEPNMGVGTQQGRSHETMGQRIEDRLPGHHQQGVGGQQQQGFSQGSGPTGALRMGESAGVGGISGGNNCGHNTGTMPCPQCHGTGGLEQRIEQGLGLGGNRQGVNQGQQGTY